MEKQRIEHLMMKSALTRDERAEIRKAAKAAGIAVEFKQACRSCYETALLKLYETAGGEMAVSVDGYAFRRRGDSFRVMGTLYSESTLPTQTVGTLAPSVIRMYFVKKQPETQEYETEVQG